VEIAQIEQLLGTHHDLLAKCAEVRPDPIELSALAAMLHAFYTGIENIFKRIALHVDGEVPEGAKWHRELLRSLASGTTNRGAVISPDLQRRLRSYLDFRHVFRHAYTFQLRWDKMAPLALACRNTLDDLKAELNKFLASLSA
jgi:hypothetical protein